MQNPKKINDPKIVMAVLAGAIALSLLFSWLIMAVYVKHDTNAMVRKLAGFFPVAKVGSETISFSDYLVARDAIETFLKSEAVQQAGGGQTMDATMEKNAYERLIHEAAVRDMAKKKSVAMTDDEVLKMYQGYVEMASSTVPDVSKYLKDTFNWTEAEYREAVVKPQLLEEKLANSYGSTTDDYAKYDEELNKRVADSDVKRYLRF
ncbi:MAG: SurA N-terminal domain-containing protein [Patescibacteria group bacterium]|nr:SurA N-terminal domain-containing protein [Patescibacteria group bacterium]